MDGGADVMDLAEDNGGSSRGNFLKVVVMAGSKAGGPDSPDQEVNSPDTARLTAAMKQDDGHSEVLLTGHTDSRGSNAYNERLALQRVKQVREWLVKRGISADRIRTESMGERQVAVWCKEPLSHEFNPDTCLSPAEHQKNCRV